MAGFGQAPSEVRVVEITSVKANCRRVIRFLGPIIGMLTHWPNKKPGYACSGPDYCPRHLHSARTIWKGYAAAEVWDAAKQVWFATVFEVTEVCEELLRGRNLRGEVWVFERPQQGKKAAPVVGNFVRNVNLDELRPAFEFRPVLVRVYHDENLLLGVENPLPPRLALPPSPPEQQSQGRTAHSPLGASNGVSEFLKANGANSLAEAMRNRSRNGDSQLTADKGGSK